MQKNRSLYWLSAVAALAVVAACGVGCGSTEDAESDAGSQDAASTNDAGADGAAVVDAARVDADAGTVLSDASVGPEGSQESDAGRCIADGGHVICPLMLEQLSPLDGGPGLHLTWIDGQPCDTIEGEREYGLIGYPSNQNPPGPPTFTLPGTALSYDSTDATMTNMYTFHARCVVQGMASVWSNELANNGHM